MAARTNAIAHPGVLSPGHREPAGVRAGLIGAALTVLVLFLVIPLAAIFVQALAKGLTGFLTALAEPTARAAFRLTLTVAAIAVPLTVVFGLAAAWAIARFDFPGKPVLITLIDLPLAVSPVISGMVFILLLGRRSPLGTWLLDHGVMVIFAVPGIVIATMFVILPLVARELIPLMHALGSEEEEGAAVLGAGGLHIFLRVTLPNIKWGLLYGTILAAARSIGEFGAVSVVSGHVRGLTTTVPLYVEMLYNEYNFAGAFAVASILVGVALITLAANTYVQRQSSRAMSSSGGDPDGN